MGPIEKQLKEKLSKALNPEEMTIINESEKHAHHKGNPGGDETHFQIYVKCSQFNGLSPLQRHKLVYKTIEEEVPEIHAISLELKKTE